MQRDFELEAKTRARHLYYCIPGMHNANGTKVRASAIPPPYRFSLYPEIQGPFGYEGQHPNDPCIFRTEQRYLYSDNASPQPGRVCRSALPARSPPPSTPRRAERRPSCTRSSGSRRLRSRPRHADTCAEKDRNAERSCYDFRGGCLSCRVPRT